MLSLTKLGGGGVSNNPMTWGWDVSTIYPSRIFGRGELKLGGGGNSNIFSFHPEPW